MKTILLASVLLTAISGSAFAGEICGTLGSHSVAPACGKGEFCPMFVRLQYDLTTAEGTRYDLETSSTAVLDNMGQMNGSSVCIKGSDIKDAFEVTAISAQ